MKQTKTSPLNLQLLVRVAVFIAMDVLLMNYLGIHTQFFKIGFSFVPIALCGMLYGAKWGTVCAGVGDLLNCFLGPLWLVSSADAECLPERFPVWCAAERPQRQPAGHRRGGMPVPVRHQPAA